MRQQDIEHIQEQIMRTAIQAAKLYLKEHDLVWKPDVLAECITSWVKIKLPEALKDAKQAYEIGMNQWGNQTWYASFVLAGIEAAKEAGVPRELAE